MTDRDRLICLIMGANSPCVSLAEGERIADYLLANGIIVPPCKVGDTVYYPWIYDGQCGIAFSKVESIKIYVNGLPIAVVEDWKSDMPMPICFNTDDFGKTVFLTKEEAKEKLKECDNNAR